MLFFLLVIFLLMNCTANKNSSTGPFTDNLQCQMYDDLFFFFKGGTNSGCVFGYLSKAPFPKKLLTFLELSMWK